ncbi:WD repeat-containing protein wrap73 [Linnemannia hyalina]|uniref:WD repeat-containing protein wrap73 n=1 Tax=Linnemannia hyalina TaxID=64524 RepID=A0A9P7XK36_9FUNG|nr:WD repeat-containing protein wrap73 [Linnemannia hyalina]
MDFTEPYRHSQFLTLYSPNGKYLASYHLAEEGFTRLHPSTPIQPHEQGGRGVIVFRFAATMQVMRVIEIRLFRDSLPTINEIGWSPDSTMLLAACPITGTVLVFSVEDEGFKATITAPGIVSAGSYSGGGGGSPNSSGGTGHRGGNTPKAEAAAAKAAQALRALGYTPPGAEILRGVRFSADSRHVLIWEDNLLRLSIWSLEHHNVTIPTYSISAPPRSPSSHVQLHQQPERQVGAKVFGIQHPKAMSKSFVTSASVPPYSTLGTTATSAAGPQSQYAHSVRGDLQYFAIVERHKKECRDYVSIYATENYWNGPPIHSFGVAEGEGGLKDVDGIVWSPDGRYLVLWENPYLGFKMAAYSMDGRCVGSYEVKPDGEHQQPTHGHGSGGLPGFSHGGGGMGVKSVCWHPKSKLLALGGYDQKIRILNHLTWKPILEFNHVAHAHYGPKTVLWRESDSTVAVTGSVRQQGGIEYTMVIEHSAWVLPTIRIDTQKPNAKIGVGWCDFNCDGTLLASRNELRLIVIIQQQSPIRVIRWDPTTPSRIVWCCGSNRVYTWRAGTSATTAAIGDAQQQQLGGSVEAVEVPAENFVVSSLKWCPDGKGLLLLDKDMFCIGFPIEDGDQHTIHDNTASIFQRLR